MLDSAVQAVLDRLTAANKRNATRSLKLGRRTDTIPAIDLLTILREQQGYRCAYCPRRIIRTFHLDHRIPLSRGGHHFLGNIQFTCSYCNLSKYAHPFPRYSKRSRTERNYEQAEFAIAQPAHESGPNLW